jgi:hypothetical protein
VALIPDPLEGAAVEVLTGAVLVFPGLWVFLDVDTGLVVERVCFSRRVSSSFVRRVFTASDGPAQVFPVVIGVFGVNGLVAALRGSTPPLAEEVWAAQFKASNAAIMKIIPQLRITRIAPFSLLRLKHVPLAISFLFFGRKSSRTVSADSGLRDYRRFTEVCATTSQN